MAHWVHGVSRSVGVGDDEEPGHDSDLSDDCVAGRSRRRAEGRPSIRDIVVSELAKLAPLASVPAADGAFYVLLRVNRNVDPLVIGERLVREHKVAVIPGTAFGMSGCYFRVAYGALQKVTVAEGIGRLVNGLRAVLT
jgi:aspartate/methionine/tyrosine aminotransferase